MDYPDIININGSSIPVYFKEGEVVKVEQSITKNINGNPHAIWTVSNLRIDFFVKHNDVEVKITLQNLDIPIRETHHVSIISGTNSILLGLINYSTNSIYTIQKNPVKVLGYYMKNKYSWKPTINVIIGLIILVIMSQTLNQNANNLIILCMVAAFFVARWLYLLFRKWEFSNLNEDLDNQLNNELVLKAQEKLNNWPNKDYSFRA